MSWIEKLYKTYEQCAGVANTADNAPLPIAHTTQLAQIEIVIDGQGKFRRAQVIADKRQQTTVIPCTEKSGGKSGTRPVNHPLCDKLQYVAGDFVFHGGEVTSGFAADPGEPHRTYIADLTTWVESQHSHPKLRAILDYVSRKEVVHDLIDAKVLPTGSDGKLLKSFTGDKKDAPEIFRAVQNTQSPEDAFVRWRVEIPGDPESAVWETPALIEAWVSYYASLQTKRGMCMTTGLDNVRLAEPPYPYKLRNSGDKAKLISSNDNSGYTFRGRFLDADQACGVSFDVTQKAHSALRWLIERQGFRNGKQVIVAWAVSGKPIPDPLANSAEWFGLEPVQDGTDKASQGDTGQSFASRLNRYLAGYRTTLGSTDEIAVMGLDSATDGRLSITYYRELTGSELRDRVESWHTANTWPQNYSTKLKFIGVPSPKDIAWAAYGSRQVEGKSGEKLRKATVERLLPCIIDGRPIPRDLVEAAVRRAASRSGRDKWDFNKEAKAEINEWEKTLGIACSLFRGQHKERNYQMALDTGKTDRDYLYGRLLAVAENIESRALYIAGEKRETTAAKLMQRFADRPCATWRTIELALPPYMARLHAKRPGFLVEMKRLMDEIVVAFQGNDFTDPRRLSGEFLLGYHCQRQALRTKTESGPETETTEPETNQGE